MLLVGLAVLAVGLGRLVTWVFSVFLRPRPDMLWDKVGAVGAIALAWLAGGISPTA